ncbi:MAG: DUF4350 domain-containing protein [Azonexus sp.]
MTRRIVWGGVLALVFTVLIGLWLATRLEQVEVDHWTPPGPAARHDPFLAMTRFLDGMGRPLRAGDGEGLDTLPPGGVMLLDAQRRSQLTPARTQGLLDWVKRGGYLIVAAEAPGVKDPLLEFFQVNCGCSASPDESEPVAEGPAEGQAENQAEDPVDSPVVPAIKAPRRPDSVSVSVPGAARPLQVDFAYRQLETGASEPEWAAGAADYPAQILHFRHGTGHVTVLASLTQLFDNKHIGHHDHAELLWTLLETYQPDHGRPVTLLTRLGRITLFEWLTRTALPATLSAAALLVLWLWSVIPRFGRTLPAVAPARRELREHLAAIGRYVWRVGGLDHWLETARESCRERLALRHPGLLALAPAEQAQALAELTRRPASLIAAALHEPARTPQSFTLALRVLRNLERSL